MLTRHPVSDIVDSDLVNHHCALFVFWLPPVQIPLAQGAARDATIIACHALQLKLAVLSGLEPTAIRLDDLSHGFSRHFSMHNVCGI